jgi:hypothetical protein
MSKSTYTKEKQLRFVSLEIKGVREFHDRCEVVEDDADAEFFSLYGREDEGFAHCIGDFSSREGAELIKAAIESGLQ